jgi:hypothetical protein
VEEQCELRRQAHEQQSDDEFDLDACREEVSRDLSDAVEEQEADLQSGRDAAQNARTKQVQPDARNGGSHLQIWAVSVSTDRGVHAADEGVAVAGAPRAWVRSPAMLASAQAEFYYDTRHGWGRAKSEALWNLRWRARLRRWRLPSSAGAGLGRVPGLLPGAGELVSCLFSSSGGQPSPDACWGLSGWRARERASARCSDPGNILCSGLHPEVIH